MRVFSASIPGVAGLLLASVAPAAHAAGRTERVDVSSTGRQANAGTSPFMVGVSGDGRYVAFPSGATNLVPGDTDGFIDAFVRDRGTGRTERVSVGPGGAQPDGELVGSQTVLISPNGRTVAYASAATNLVRGDGNGLPDLFAYDRATRKTERLSVSPAGADGNGRNYEPLGFSANGRLALFISEVTNLVPNDTNGFADVFVRDIKAGRTERVNVSSTGEQADADSYDKADISANGRFVAFATEAHNLGPANGNIFNVYVRDRAKRQTEWVNKGFGDALNPSISADGHFVAFTVSNASGSNIYVRDRATGKAELVSAGIGGGAADGTCDGADLSADGRFVSFYSEATNLVPGDTNGVGDVFVRDRRTGRTERVSVGQMGVQANGAAINVYTTVSEDGRVVPFASEATNLIRHDTNGAADVFVRVRGGS